MLTTNSANIYIAMFLLAVDCLNKILALLTKRLVCPSVRKYLTFRTDGRTNLLKSLLLSDIYVIIPVRTWHITANGSVKAAFLGRYCYL